MTEHGRDPERGERPPIEPSTDAEGQLGSAYAPPPRRPGLLQNPSMVGVIVVLILAVVVFLVALAG